MSDLPPLTWIRTFEAAARLESFSAAAAELALTQPAVSQHVRQLEARLERQLFRRLRDWIENPGAARQTDLSRAMGRFKWKKVAPRLDATLVNLCQTE